MNVFDTADIIEVMLRMRSLQDDLLRIVDNFEHVSMFFEDLIKKER